ncbi:MAG: hypothetical protein ACI9CD_000045 [Candidatus Deianiraeaceae bacterium]|jgi:hypothetical protein
MCYFLEDEQCDFASFIFDEQCDFASFTVELQELLPFPMQVCIPPAQAERPAVATTATATVTVDFKALFVELRNLALDIKKQLII